LEIGETLTLFILLSSSLIDIMWSVASLLMRTQINTIGEEKTWLR